ncbi:MAG: uroporphyrinogen-III synthase/uroporphyrinogen-III C-methyltransferase [Acidimicrobiaceae bacterium]|nr:uroporphyrinogen-III synthase/uroporphyrinogen-III C-methyltransferase [Acidimicrobiaceae bacterium]
MTVYLVGAGPGDPGLLTRRGAALLAKADLVVYDRLVDQRLLLLAPPSAELVDVGKRAGSDAELAQRTINALLVRAAHQGRCVVRLKGGDPYVLGRGGEEALALAAAEVPYEVVPGVSAAFAAPALAGVPVTHRGLASAVMVVSGHDPDSGALAPDWQALAASRATLVVLMGAARRAEIARLLIAGGLPKTTPVVAVERAGGPAQRTWRTVLAELGDCPISSPSTLVIGEVAALALASREDRPLHGLTVVVTRAPAQAGELVALLEEEGAEVFTFPTVALVDPADGGAALRAACARLGEQAWVVLTSANAVERLFFELHDARALGATRVAAIGRATATALARHGVVADLVPDDERSEGLLSVFPRPGAGERRGVLLARAAEGRAVLPDGLAEQGWQVEVVEAYRTVTAPASDESLAALDAVEAEAITFASASALIGFLAIAGRDRVPAVVATLGPVTSAAARAAGLEVAVEAAGASAEELARSLADHLWAVRSAHG